MPRCLRSVEFRKRKLPCRTKKKKKTGKKNATGLPREAGMQIMWSLRKTEASVSVFSIPSSSPLSCVHCIYVLWNSLVSACHKILVENNSVWITKHALTLPVHIPHFKYKIDHVEEGIGINISKSFLLKQY